MSDASSLALLASLAKDSEGDSPSGAPADKVVEPETGDDDLVAVMDEFRKAPDARAALASLRAIVRRLQQS